MQLRRGSIVRSSAPKLNPARLQFLIDAGYLILAAPPPGGHQNGTGDKHSGGSDATTSGYAFRKRGRGKRHGEVQQLTLDTCVCSARTEEACSGWNRRRSPPGSEKRKSMESLIRIIPF